MRHIWSRLLTAVKYVIKKKVRGSTGLRNIIGLLQNLHPLSTDGAPSRLYLINVAINWLYFMQHTNTHFWFGLGGGKFFEMAIIRMVNGCQNRA